MWFDNSLDVIDILKNGFSFPVALILILPLMMVMSPVNGAQNFPVYRVNQFDVAGNTYGCRNTLVNMEARTINSGSITRKCVVARLSDISLSVYRDIVDQNAGAIVIILPAQFDNLTVELQERFLALEKLMLSEEITLPIYFALETEEISEIYQQVRSAATTDRSTTATDALLRSVSANGFQMNVHTSAATKLSKHKTINIHGILEGNGNADRLPTVLIVAHYDSMSAAPGLSYGADSNGSGVAALLELMRIFSRLFSSSVKPDYNIAFLLTGSGKLNYFGTKKWLAEMKESDKFPYLSEVESVICLDSIGADSPNLYAHVSKPPKEGSANAQLFDNLKKVASEKQSSVEMIHKKIYLGDTQLAWEHEQFAMNKLAGMTISALDTHKSPRRTSALDIKSSVNRRALSGRIHVIGEAVARHIYKLYPGNETESQLEILQGDLAVQSSMVAAWLDLLTSSPRAAQLVDTTSPLIGSFEQAFNRHLRSVEKTSYSQDKRDPEFTLYSSSIETMHVYSVKPAIFDLVLAVVIGAYLGVIYLLSMVYPRLATVLMNKPKKA